MTNQANIIADLINWIESNLEKSMSIDQIAEKSGYSKWHLQRMFKKVTGCILGAYIRHRRLTNAALTLRLTSKSILDIASQYCFDSQQTFTRSFKKQFAVTPASYRQAEYWNLNGLLPAFELYKKPLLATMPKVIDYEEQIFWGIPYKSRCNLYQLFHEKQTFRQRFFKDYLTRYVKDIARLPNQVFSFGEPKLIPGNMEEQEIIYTIALKDKRDIDGMDRFVLQSGRYAVFKYIGSPLLFWDFITQIYLEVLPKLAMKRRRGIEIEIFNNCDKYNFNNSFDQAPEKIECDYCIPIEITDHHYGEVTRSIKC